MDRQRSVAIVGGGAFGVSAANELRRRGFAVIPIDPGPLPHPDASSTDRIDRDPDREGLAVACGGSGHGFKVAPLLGPIIADVLEERPNRHAERFAWRERGRVVSEQARHDG